MLPRFLIALATVLLVRGLWLVSSTETLDVHSGAQFTGHLIDFAALLSAGDPFPQWSVFSRHGFGSPYLGYYQPGFSYVAAPFLWVSGNPQSAIALAIALLLALGVTGMYRLALRIFASSKPDSRQWLAATAAIAFVAHPYMTVNLYERGDFAEFAFAMILPWVILAPSALTTAAAVLFHPLVAYPLYLASALWSRRLWRPLALGALLSAFYWLPLVAELGLVRIDNAFVPALQPERHMLAPGHVLMIGSSAPSPFDYQPNWALMGICVAAILFGTRKTSNVRNTTRTCLAVWVVLIFLMSPASLFIWSWLPLLAKLQFPWRLQNFAAVMLAILCACGVAAVTAALESSRARVNLRIPVFTLICGLIMMPLAFIQPKTLPRSPMASTADIMASGFLGDPMDEWLPKTATIRMGLSDQAPVTRGPCRASSMTREPGRLTVTATAETALPSNGQEDACEIILPHFYYPVGWTTRPSVPLRNHDGFMALELPGSALSHGPQDIVLINKSTPARIWGITVSAIALSILGFWRIRRRGSQRKPVDNSAPAI